MIEAEPGGGSRSLRVAAFGALMTLFLVGCQSSTPDPYGADIAAAGKAATSDFERGVLTDRKISAGEYEEANQRWLTCMVRMYPTSEKVKVTLQRDAHGLYAYGVSGLPDDMPDATFDKNSDNCSKGTTELIAPLFNDMKTNPRHLSAAALIVGCLKRNHVVPAAYTERNLRADLARVTPSPVQGDGGRVTTEPASVDQASVTGLKHDDPRVRRCITDPNAKDGTGAR